MFYNLEFFCFFTNFKSNFISNYFCMKKKSSFSNILNRFKQILPINVSRINKNYLIDIADNHIIHYPSPITLTYAWSFGSLAGICLTIQVLSGVFLAMHYTPHIDLAFNSVEYIMRDVKNGWLIRYIHANGASMCVGKTHCKVFYLKHTDRRYFLSSFFKSLLQICLTMLRYEKYHQFGFMRIMSGVVKKLNIIIKTSATRFQSLIAIALELDRVFFFK